MMRSKHTLLGSVVLLAATLVGSTGFAADHTDSPRTTADQSADINDVYVFRGTSDDLEGAIGGDNDRLTTVLVMTVFPIADANSRFSDKVSYQFHINAGNANLHVTCTATTPDGDNNQNVTCTAGTVGGGAFASDTAAVNAVSPGDPGNESMRIFAGLRDDPFFFDLLAFRSVLDSVFAGAPDPTPLVDAAGVDFFEPLNTLSIVVEIDNGFFQSSDRVRVWASTQRLMPE